MRQSNLFRHFLSREKLLFKFGFNILQYYPHYWWWKPVKKPVTGKYPVKKPVNFAKPKIWETSQI